MSGFMVFVKSINICERNFLIDLLKLFTCLVIIFLCIRKIAMSESVNEFMPKKIFEKKVFPDLYQAFAQAPKTKSSKK